MSNISFKNKVKIKNYVNSTLLFIAVAIFILILIFPFYWQIVTSLKSPADLFKTPADLYPKKIFLGYYSNIFTKRPFVRYLTNSLLVSIATTIISIVTASFCAYSIARLDIKFKSFIMSFVLAVSVFPGIALVSPLYVTFAKLHLLNTYWGLIIPYTTFALPLAIWNLQAFFKDIPRSLDESAKIDGATPFMTFWRIILPLTGPGLFATFIMVFITSWNEFLFGLIFVTKDLMRTVPIGIMMFQGEYDIPWGDISAASVFVTIPIIIIVLIFQKRIVSGITGGAVKG